MLHMYVTRQEYQPSPTHILTPWHPHAVTVHTGSHKCFKWFWLQLMFYISVRDTGCASTCLAFKSQFRPSLNSCKCFSIWFVLICLDKLADIFFRASQPFLIQTYIPAAVGAADDASHVATMLEVARALVSENAKQLAAPVTFLFTGGEETLSQVTICCGCMFAF